MKFETLAVIPARSGSKGLPNKNILPLAGHPLIAYSIKAARICPLINRTIVSTDSPEIAEIAKSYGAEVPFLRPVEFAQDTSTDLDVFKHTLTWLQENENYRPDFIVQLRPTSPVRFKDEMVSAIKKLINSDADSLRVVTIAPETPYKMWLMDGEEKPMKPLLKIKGVKEPYNEPRQRLPEVYWQVGTLDVIRRNVIIGKNSMSGKRILPFVINSKYAVDIDDLSAFKRAEEIISFSDCIKF